MSYKTLPIILLDFETGGFESQIHAVTEVAAIAFDSESFEEIARYEAILKPYNDELLYDPKALLVTGITMEMINNGVDFKTFTKDFISFLRKANIHSHPKYKPLIAGHNITFDIPFLQQLMFFMGKKIEDYFNCNADYKGNYYPKNFDTQYLSMVKWPELVSHTLGSCVNKAGFEIVNAHRAMVDVKSNTDLFHTFIKSLKNQNNSAVVVEEKPFRDKFKF